MEKFEASFTRERSVTMLLLGILLVFLILGFFIFMLMPSGRGISLIFAMVAIISVVGWLLFLKHQYDHKPQVLEKRKLEQQYDSELVETSRYENDLRNSASRREKINAEREARIKQRQEIFTSEKTKLADRRKQISIDEDEELSKNLKALRNGILLKGLQSALIVDAKIPGIGPKLKATLQGLGITNAVHLYRHSLDGIEGFGESKSAAMIAWRNEVRSTIEYTLPRSLPSNVVTNIRAKYAAKAVEFDQLDQDQDRQLEQDLARIDHAAGRSYDEVNDRETQAETLLAQSRTQGVRFAERLARYKPITFPNFIKSSLPGMDSTKNVGWLVGAGLVAVTGFHTIMALGSTASMIVAAIPTATGTPTLTITPTFTGTPSFTPTFTSTFIPTITLTPTITETPTNTFTPTITPIPSSTLPSGAWNSCVPNSARQVGKVVGVVDGDTIDVNIDGEIFRVRYIGIDAPETSIRQDYYGPQATAKNRELVDGKMVTLVKDVSETDQYDRLVRYVFAGSVFVNYQLIEAGYAYASSNPPDIACQNLFTSAQGLANTSNLGLWQPTLAPASVVPPPTRGGNLSCDASYPDVCIAPPPPDLDCKDVSYKRFKVVGSDPHNFDGDGDGIGCES